MAHAALCTPAARYAALPAATAPACCGARPQLLARTRAYCACPPVSTSLHVPCALPEPLLWQRMQGSLLWQRMQQVPLPCSARVRAVPAALLLARGSALPPIAASRQDGREDAGGAGGEAPQPAGLVPAVCTGGGAACGAARRAGATEACNVCCCVLLVRGKRGGPCAEPASFGAKGTTSRQRCGQSNHDHATGWLARARRIPPARPGPSPPLPRPAPPSIQHMPLPHGGSALIRAPPPCSCMNGRQAAALDERHVPLASSLSTDGDSVARLDTTPPPPPPPPPSAGDRGRGALSDREKAEQEQREKALREQVMASVVL